MPFFLLMALFVAFGLDDLAPRRPPADPKTALRVAETVAWIAGVAVAALAFGRWISAAVTHRGGPTVSLRKRYLWGLRFFDLAGVLAYAWIIHQLGWATIVRNGMGGLRYTLFINAVILLPYLLIQIATWWGIYPAELSLRSGLAAHVAGRFRHLTLRIRQTLGLVLPALIVYSVGPDLISRQWPGWSSKAWVQPLEVILTGALMLMLSPLFIRLAWPTRPLPPGPLRDRLENQARRVGFRYSDILVWDTGNGLVNACVTGSLPWFRYVLLSDALLEYLNEYEVAAVFGHELGHIAHRHLIFFGFFIVGSLGVLAMFDNSVEVGLTTLSAMMVGRDQPVLATLIESALALIIIAAYAYIVFGHISRRFERQADLFGCRAVSCLETVCPPHADIDRSTHNEPLVVSPCPVGIRIFANALSNVAILNGVDKSTRSWRHGTIAQRIAFVEGLEARPKVVRQFQRGVFRLRLLVAMILGTALLLAMRFGSFPRLR